MSKRFRITIEDRKEKNMYKTEVDMAIIHVANKNENNLLITESIITSLDRDEIFRLYLSLGRAIQHNEFGEIHKDIGKIKEANLFEFMDF